jgi:23S rRNA U2552 (ribose-2'-O)-methylase RlmE/FtsJ
MEYKFGQDIIDSHRTPTIFSHHDLVNLKIQTGKYEPMVWKKARWFVNDYDFKVEPTSQIVNRAFYKYWDIASKYSLYSKLNEKAHIFHAAEAPGGFIQVSLCLLPIHRGKEVKVPDADGFVVSHPVKARPRIHTISILHTRSNLVYDPLIVKSKQVEITFGKDCTGDITPDNIDHFYEKNPTDYFSIITADGGIDEGNDFNLKEKLHRELILKEVYCALKLQAPGGHFILKVFDTVSRASLEVLYLLSKCYSDMRMYKPLTSRPTNSEKYVICLGFCPALKEIMLKKILTVLSNCNSELFLFEEQILPDFVKDVKAMNDLFIDLQCRTLQKAIKFCQLPNCQIPIDLAKKKRVVYEKWLKNFNL